MLLILILLICISLTGIIGVQFFWIRNAIQVKTEQFNRGVNDALNQAVSRLETRDNLFMISQNLVGNQDDSVEDAYSGGPHVNIRYQLDSLLAESDLDLPPPPPPPPSSGRFEHSMEIHYNI